jgi:hypothetical protein
MGYRVACDRKPAFARVRGHLRGNSWRRRGAGWRGVGGPKNKKCDAPPAYPHHTAPAGENPLRSNFLKSKQLFGVGKPKMCGAVPPRNGVTRLPENCPRKMCRAGWFHHATPS